VGGAAGPAAAADERLHARRPVGVAPPVAAPLAVAGAAEAAAQWVPERVSAEWGPRAAEAGF